MMTQSSAASPGEPMAALTPDERVAAAARFRRFGYILIAAGALLGLLGIAMAIFTSNPIFLILLSTTVIDIVLALRQFAAARNV